MRWRAPLFLLTLLAAAGCDQATKHVAREVLAGSPAISLAADLVRFELALNPGGFLSFGASLPDEIRSLFFLAVVPLGLLLVCVLLLRAGPLDRAALVGLGLVAGGGLANWIDRLVAGVRDRRQDGLAEPDTAVVEPERDLHVRSAGGRRPRPHRR